MTIDIETHDAIKRRLRRKGVMLSDIASESSCSASFVTMVCQGRRSNQKVEQAISRHLGECIYALWPAKLKREGEE